jgi:hypothetical protein
MTMHGAKSMKLSILNFAVYNILEDKVQNMSIRKKLGLACQDRRTRDIPRMLDPVACFLWSESLVLPKKERTTKEEF